MPGRIAVVDLETDPFEYGKMIQPFVAGFYDGERVLTFWSDDCVARLVKELEGEPEPWTIYAHNGGRFDFFYFMPYIRNDARIINGRIVQASMGKHELRDSFAIMPFPLADYDKDSIDYEKMKAEVRESHRDEILKYLRKDLTSLYELVTAFHAEFGDKLTIGSASMKQIKARHRFTTGSKSYDEKWRKDFYFGGRNQVFKAGVTKGDIRVYDVNSMYPYVMSAYLHPIGISNYVSRDIERNTVFVVAAGKNFGAFPTRAKDGSLDFTRESGTFCTTIHEYKAAVETGCFKTQRIIKTYNWNELGTFDDFVNHFYTTRAAAKKSGDKIKAIFYKYVLNSGYGKFAQNPENYFDWHIAEGRNYPPEWHECGATCAEECERQWTPSFIHENYIVWKRPLQNKQQSWYNIATGASITGAARSVLLRGLHATVSPLYVDTDSIICRGNSRVTIHSSNLGQWDLEACGSQVAIAGKKLYGIFKPVDALTTDERSKIFPEKATEEQLKKLAREYIVGELACVKKAHKGVRLTAREILAITKGETIEANNPVPSFKWDGTHTFTSRKVRRTA